MPEYVYVSGSEFVEATTKAIEREFRRSRPKPRNTRMGFPPDPNKPKRTRWWRSQ